MDKPLPLTPERSALMARVRGKNTKPELIVRRLLYSSGYRYRLHVRKFPGTPDIVFIGRRKAIFVHGCFWHRHEGCSKASMPKTRVAFWIAKFAANQERDDRKTAELAAIGWATLIVWECQTKDAATLVAKLKAFLTSENELRNGV